MNENSLSKPLVLRALTIKLSIVFLWVSCLQSVSANACSSPLGVENGETILSADIEFSNRKAADAKLNKSGGWCQSISNEGYLQVKFKEERFITGVATQGSVGYGQVLEYKLQFSEDETEWWDYMEDGKVKVFNGNLGDESEVVRNDLTIPVRALLLRFRPLRSRGSYTCLRIEAYGCKACGNPLGFEDGRIPDSSFSTPKILKKGYEAYRARLNKYLGGGSWCPPGKSHEAYLRIDLGKVHIIDAILTQGNPNSKLYYYYQTESASCSSSDPTLVKKTDENNVTTCTITRKKYSPAFVKTYFLDYSIDGIQWRTYGEKGSANKILTANRDENTIKTSSLFPKPKARYVSYRPRTSLYNHCSRLEILGCEACMGDIGLSHGRIPNQQMTSSSNAGSDFQPWLARLKNPRRAWCANKSDSAPYLQVDLWNTHKIRHISTQGFSSTSDNWVQEYTIGFSTDGDEWFTYKENGVKKVFTGNSDSESEVKISLSSPIYAVYIRVLPTKWIGESACLRLELYGCKAASDGLGMEAGETMTLISNHRYSGYYPSYGRLNHDYGYIGDIPGIPEQSLFFRVDLGPSSAIITGIATQRYKGQNHYVRRYSLRFSDDMLEWMTYNEGGNPKMFEGNHLRFTTVRYTFRNNVTTRYVELVVKEGNGRRIGLRMELYGIKYCEQPLGMENGQISNDSLTSPDSKPDNPPGNARLNGPSAWCGTDIYKSYLEIDFKTLHRITAIAMQGNPTAAEYVKTYELFFRRESPEWEIYRQDGKSKVFKGASTSTLAVIERPVHPILATMIRIKALTYRGSVCMRVEIYGCKEIHCSSSVGLTTFQVPANKISASSSFGPSYLPNHGRLDTHLGYGAWCAAVHDGQQFLQIDLPRMYVINGFASQGKHRLSKDGLGDAWVTSYKVSYSKDLFQWEYLQDVNYTEVLVANVKNNMCNSSIANNSSTSNGTIFSSNNTSSNGTIFSSNSTTSNNSTASNGTISSNNNTSNCSQANATLEYTVKKVQIYFDKIFYGNSKFNVTVKHMLQTPFKSKVVRFQPRSWFNMPCMRVELYGCKDCFTPLGMVDGKIPDSALRADMWSYTSTAPKYARLYSNGNWIYNSMNDNQFLHIYVGPQTKFISAVATESTSHSFVKVFTVSFSPNGGDWMDYMENGKAKFFRGNFNLWSPALNHFSYPLKAQYVKLNIKAVSKNSIRLRVELYGCAVDCYKPILPSIADENFEATSSDISVDHHPHNARLSLLANITAWCPSNSNPNNKLEVNLGKSFLISQVAIQGYKDQLTKKVRLYYKENTTPWVMYTDNFGRSDLLANSNDSSITRIFIKYPFKASYISFLALELEKRSCMRVEVYGCKECQEKITSNQEFETNSGVQASSYFDPNFKPKFGSMRYGVPNNAWCAQYNDNQQFLQFDNLVDFKITGITTTGSAISPNESNGSWVNKYRLEYSSDGKVWKNYTENGYVKIFNGSESYQDEALQAVDQHLVARFVRLFPTRWQNWICMKASLTGCSDCSSALGLETKKLKTIRSSWSSTYRYPTYGILHSGSGFVANNYLHFQIFLEIQLQTSRASITAVAMQPDYHDNIGVWTYYLSYNLNGEQWFDYNENGATRYFRGYRDRETAVKQVLSRPITVRFIRFNPLIWRSRVGFRVELYGCQACEKPLGMRSGQIKNTSITASTYEAGYEPWFGRIGSNGSWCSQFSSPHKHHYLQVDLEMPAQVSGLEIEGDAVTSKYVQQVLVSYSKDEGYWKMITKDGETFSLFDANLNGPDMTIIEFPRPITARYVRVNPKRWNLGICMRIELRGCRDVQKENCTTTIGMEHGYIKNETISASSSLGPDYQPWFARLNTNILGGGWCAGANNSNQYLHVNFVEHYKVKILFLQGKSGSPSAWLTKFSVQYSLDGSAWTTYREQSNEVFDGIRNGQETIKLALENPFIARYIRILPREWHNWVCMRIEFAGCKVLAQAYGLETQEVGPELLSGSHITSTRFEYARLYFNNRWYSNLQTGVEYLEITLQPFGKVITAFAVQGFHRLITMYTVSYSVDDKNWYGYKVDGKVKMFKVLEDLIKVSRVVLSRPLLASKLRITPKQWITGIALRTELYGYDSCFDRLKIGSLHNSSLNASSSLPNHEPWRAKFGGAKNDSWCPVTTSPNEYLEIDLGDTYLVSAIATEGDPMKNCWINKFSLEYKEPENDTWQYYGKQTLHTLEKISFRAADPLIPRYLVKMEHKLEARYVRIHPEESIECPCLRFEIYGCQACEIELGMTTSRIKDDAITASGYLNPASLPSNARLYSKEGLGAWCAGPNETSPFLQVDLFWVHKVRSIATQGRNDGAAWVEQFTLSYREDNKHWQNYSEGGITKVFTANNDGSFVVKHSMNLERVRYLRIHPVKWHQAACLRLELYGCEVTMKSYGVALGMQDRSIPDSAITASYWSFSPYYARLFKVDGGWSSTAYNRNKFLLIDLGLVKTLVTRIATQGWTSSGHSVLEYHLSLSREGIFWFRYMENGQPKIFNGNSYKDTQTPVEHNLHHTILTRYLKFEVLRYYYNPAMRVEAYGYREYPKSLLGNGSNPNSVDYVIKSSSNLTVDSFPVSHATPGVSWCSEFNDSRQYLQVDFKRDVLVSAIRLDIIETTSSTSVVLFYAMSGQGFRPLKQGNVSKVFYNGMNLFQLKMVVSGIRIMPTWQNTMCLHLDILGEDMSNPIGFQDQRVQDQTMSASTQLTAFTRPSYGRVSLDNVRDAWCAGEEDSNQFLSIDIGYIQVIDRVATQGRHTTGLDSWVTKYSIRYSEDGVDWKWCKTENETVKIFEGNTDYYMVVKNKLPKPVRARYVEVHPRSWQGNLCMRIELYGYTACANPLGMNTGLIPDSSISGVGTSTSLRLPIYARLHKFLGDGAWCAKPSSAEKYLQIDLGIDRLISGFATQGSQKIADAFVKSYNVFYRPNDGSWTFYTENATKHKLKTCVHTWFLETVLENTILAGH
ncbi:uncharacterized protein LOC116308982 [Actinia tenebrosa]|uniref:Uncharacterized protein LOC116308982 n=1 Tax=Actinia tenebrosa TaxID=6105 RepID=A0A6P8J5J3_ACTTE|nr:uncharacterized protein LOC116308982 [Actinia tenebrosa]